MCCLFLCNLSQQPPVCPLVVCFVWQKSAVVQAANRTKLASPLIGKLWYHVFSGQSWHYWGIQAGCATQFEQILIHLWLFTSWVNILSFLGTQIFCFLCHWCTFTLKILFISTYLGFLTNCDIYSDKISQREIRAVANIFLGWKIAFFCCCFYSLNPIFLDSVYLKFQLIVYLSSLQL